MSTDSGDTTSVGRADDEPESVKVSTDSTDDAQSPYDIGLAADEDETGPKPLRPELDDEEVQDG